MVGKYLSRHYWLSNSLNIIGGRTLMMGTAAAAAKR
jgi:hypothetical protein